MLKYNHYKLYFRITEHQVQKKDVHIDILLKKTLLKLPVKSPRLGKSPHEVVRQNIRDIFKRINKHKER
jgi:hypothetical protein